MSYSEREAFGDLFVPVHDTGHQDDRHDADVQTETPAQKLKHLLRGIPPNHTPRLRPPTPEDLESWAEND